MNFTKNYIFIVAFFCFGIGIFISGFQDGIGSVSMEIERTVEIFVDYMNILALIGLIFYNVFVAYMNVNFTAWLKNKYDIKRW